MINVYAQFAQLGVHAYNIIIHEVYKLNSFVLADK